MGRWVVLIIVLAGIFAALMMSWLHSHEQNFQLAALQGLITDFQAQREHITSSLPAECSLNATDSWSFEFKGDELWVQVPTLEKPVNPQAADFLHCKGALETGFRAWLANRPGNPDKFPVRLQFRNEKPAASAVPGTPSPAH